MVAIISKVFEKNFGGIDFYNENKNIYDRYYVVNNKNAEKVTYLNGKKCNFKRTNFLMQFLRVKQMIFFLNVYLQKTAKF